MGGENIKNLTIQVRLSKASQTVEQNENSRNRSQGVSAQYSRAVVGNGYISYYETLKKGSKIRVSKSEVDV